MFWIKFIQSLITTLNADVSESEIAAGIVLGATIGLVPKSNLIALALLLILWIFRFNLGMAGAAMFVFAVLGHLTDPIAEQLGFWALTGVEPLQGLWTTLYNTPIVPFTAFNNTLVMGNLLFSFLIAIPLYFASKAGVRVYRERCRERVMKLPLARFFKVSHYVDLAKRWEER